MTTPRVLHGRILTATGWVRGNIEFDQRVRRIRATHDDADGGDGPLILPGFIDLHVHGGAGVDLMQGGDVARTVARTHARHGTTALLGTTMTAHEDDIVQALHGLADAIAIRTPDMARVLGVHLEGPYISLERLGAQPPLAIEATMAQVRRLHAVAPIRVLTLAPEVGQHLALIPQLVALGIRVQLGHSAGSYEDGVAALQAGASGFTHLFNGMTGLDHYRPGIAAAALAHAEYAELIPDLQHVHPGAIRTALRAIPRLYCVTDATAATGMPDGEYALGSQRVHKCLGCVRLGTGSLAGSALTMDQALRNLVSLGLDLADASDRLSRYPADYLDLHDRGRLQAEAWADLVVLDPQLQVQRVFVEGDEVALA
ncbi:MULTISPECIES: N-acetylglucosamine-6-phosphate deacetylase [unclassified Lysobacter]|uniref:N-acetylglucosamine-6-phosphate deacetylase n=1 Tax=unclassified Lysobacter TaxID=2635362 RepID=UPI0006F82274|nr:MULTISPECIES: N-acetylglucosamine-6-phosphate deacetylase [unclassified Lysobacter]KQZ57042.1 N-acetylglucosamine-6-phosphate deacetylase [Lysobacter sp. Root559]KRC34893.1 N-acetylglucosamine-6-phosphate deacetylase [Lysobacter sp. Root76]KRD70582.1 N-acetylglucosamine-6-phosphate deacetylase [Lysobacter sp. Root96]